MNDIFHEIDSLDKTHARLTLVAYLKDATTEQLGNDPEQRVSAAYKIAGLMATDFAQSLIHPILSMKYSRLLAS